jgi:CRISPR-associated protein Csx17
MTSTEAAQRVAVRHVLTGLGTEPLASYLAGLGLIRLIGAQADPAATAAWTTDGLVIETAVADIPQWLAQEYEPTPVISPWNGGSGFGAKDVEPRKRLARLLAGDSPRLAGFRAAADAAEAALRRGRAAGWITEDAKGDSKVADKQRLVQEFRNRCPEKLLPWIDACVVLTSDRALFPPLLGTGGNSPPTSTSSSWPSWTPPRRAGPGRRRARGTCCRAWSRSRWPAPRWASSTRLARAGRRPRRTGRRPRWPTRGSTC